MTRTNSLAAMALATLAPFMMLGCEPDHASNPEDESTGNPPLGPEVIFSFDATDAPPFLDNNLSATNAVTGTYTTAAGVLVPLQENGAFPAIAGQDADLIGGVGFGTYPNPDIRGPGTAWEEGNDFRSVLTAQITLSQPGDAVTFCRTVAATCATATLDAAGNGLVTLTIAANVPDTEIGEIDTGISAAIRGTGDSGLTIALSDPTAVAFPFSGTAGSSFELSWTISRGDIPGSLDYSVAVDGTELASGNTSAALLAALAAAGGVSMIFDDPLGGAALEADYSYRFEGGQGNFTNPLGAAPLSPQPDLIPTPLYIYPTLDPDYELLTLLGVEGATHVVQPEDAVLAGFVGSPGEAPVTTAITQAFNGDDFAGSPFEGLIDQGLVGAGFYPSPTLCYSQIFPLVQQAVEAGVQREVHRAMYASIANGVLAADPGLEGLSAALQAPPFNLPAATVGYTRVGNIGGGDIVGYVTIGTDYADNNLQTNITTSVLATYNATLAEAMSQTFLAELNGILGALEDNNNAILNALIGAGALTMQDYQSLKTLQFGLTTPPGSQDGLLVNGAPVLDDGDANCRGYDCNVALVRRDVINGSNVSGQNPPPAAPGLAATCLWGVPPTPEQPAEDATLTGNLATDQPAYDLIPAQAAIPPARETAAGSITALLVGVYSNFVDVAYGLEVPASNFSVTMKTGDTASGTAPSISTITITR